MIVSAQKGLQKNKDKKPYMSLNEINSCSLPININVYPKENKYVFVLFHM